MRHDLLALTAVRVFYWSAKGPSYRRPASCGACRAKEVWITALLLVLFFSSRALADTFGLGSAGPGNWAILETGANQVSFANQTNITSGSNPSAANLGITSGGKLNTSGTVTIAGTYYKFSTNSQDNSNSTLTINGGTNTASDSLLTSAASAATAAANALSSLSANQSLGTLSASTTINATIAGRNVISLTGINLNGALLTLNSNGQSNVSFVINVSGNLNLGSVQLIGGLAPKDVIFNVTGPNNNIALGNESSGISTDGIFMDINGQVTLTNNNTLNGEIISGNSISLQNNGDVQAIQTVPEASTAACFTLGPLTLVAVMLLHKRFSRRKPAVVRASLDPVEASLAP